MNTSFLQKLQSAWRTDYKWIILAIAFFIVWKFVLIHVLWHDRILPPEPDDSYTYVENIASVSKCPNLIFCGNSQVSLRDSSGFIYLSYRVFFGSIAKFFSVSPQTMYHLVFYVGTVLMPFALFLFLKNFTQRLSLIAFTLFFLALYHGNGDVHGFFWVVPSFFAALLFFLLFTYALKELRIPLWGVIPLTIVFTFMHPLSVYMTLIIPLHLAIEFILKKRIDYQIVKRALFLVASVLFLSFFQTFYLSTIDGSEFYTPADSATQTRGIFEDLLHGNLEERVPTKYSIVSKEGKNFIDQRIDTMNAAYFKWLFPHWILILPFLFLLVILAHKKEIRLISFYLASLLFFIVSTFFNEYGFRAAIIVWPVTFIIVAFGAWYTAELVLQKIRNPFGRKLFIVFFITGIFLFSLVNALYAFTINSNINYRHNYSIDPNFAAYMKEAVPAGTPIYLHYILARTDEGQALKNTLPLKPLTDRPELIAVIDGSSATLPTTSTLGNRLSALLGTGAINTDFIKPLVLPEEYSFVKEFGMIKIYKK